MKVPDISLDMKTAFDQYLLTGDNKIIARYTPEQLKQVSAFFDNDELMPSEKAILERITELNEITNRKRTNRDKWIDRIVSFISGVLVGIALKWITCSW
jgi:hypothetical protein